MEKSSLNIHSRQIHSGRTLVRPGSGCRSLGPSMPGRHYGFSKRNPILHQGEKVIQSEFQPPARSERFLGVHFWWPVKDVCPKLTFALPMYGG